MGHFGFSYVGLIFLFMLIVPNLIWAKNQPQDYNFKNENRVLLLFERLGQVLVTFAVLIFSDFNPREWSLWTVWLVAAVFLMLAYEAWWIRYFKSKKTLADFYSSFCGIPVAGATLPVTAFFLLGVYGKVFWLMLSVMILGIGHIGIHLQHRKEIQ
ncbi:hypothetical protein Sgly_1755 [Syntrophobotulus glycolicus DSM 8271]|uniref:Uncharacterized protein n=1 Tax=Syntrophobotulus glycolicus (strain DSM 8271 / FlGlyR) TaxID=645991 RepID=F0SZG6_SYNGF|nr:hypothetical protein [Syntrophobotulus glycolicus]ADY56052.1 hypothetical protein Sgly_1755 [Syntrophobotulus glycolicus DSM 8271]